VTNPQIDTILHGTLWAVV